MDNTLRQGLRQKADDFGFDSIQALLRYVSKAVIDGRPVNFGFDDWGQPTPEAAARLNKAAKEAVRDHRAGKLKSFDNTEDALNYLNNL
jgi:hypothetical protein